jgi:hypothetical protein
MPQVGVTLAVTGAALVAVATVVVTVAVIASLAGKHSSPLDSLLFLAVKFARIEESLPL